MAQAYSTSSPLFNLLDRPQVPPLVRSLDQVRGQLREGNGRYTHGRGARRRSCAEHQLDEGALLLRALGVHGQLIAVGRHHCRALRRRSIVPAAQVRCRCAVQTIHPWELLSAPVDPGARALHDARGKMRVARDWLDRNGPASGWCRRQSRARAERLPEATAYQLPSRSRRAFYAWRRVVRWLVGELRALHIWWDAVNPAPRPVASTAKPERRQGECEHPSLIPERGAGFTPARALIEWAFGMTPPTTA